MATRSTIANLNTDGTVTAIYCHYDGYIQHNGLILKNHYTDPVKLQTLIALGALSAIGSEIGERQDFENPTNRNWCRVYGRDRGETDTEATTYANVAEWLETGGQEYNYLWDGTEWLVSGYYTQHELRSLVQVMLEGDQEDDQ